MLMGGHNGRQRMRCWSRARLPLRRRLWRRPGAWRLPWGLLPPGLPGLLRPWRLPAVFANHSLPRRAAGMLLQWRPVLPWLLLQWVVLRMWLQSSCRLLWGLGSLQRWILLLMHPWLLLRLLMVQMLLPWHMLLALLLPRRWRKWIRVHVLLQRPLPWLLESCSMVGQHLRLRRCIL